MSVVISSSCTSFLRGLIDAADILDDSGRIPFTLGGWIKFTQVDNWAGVAAVGRDTSANSHKLHSKSGNDIRYLYDQNTNDGYADTATSAISTDTWYYLAMSRASATSGSIWLSVHSGTMARTEDTTDRSSGDWSNGDELRKVSFGSTNISLLASGTDHKGIKLSDWALWQRELTSTELGDLKDGANPQSIASLLKGHWFSQTGTYSTAIEDAVGSADLTAYISGDGSEETTSANWPTYDSTDNPTVTSVDPDPVLTSPNANESVTTATPTVTTDIVSGTAFGLIQAAADAAPTDPDDLIDDVNAFTKAITSTSITFDQQTGLTASTDYKCYFTQETTGGLQADIVFDTFTTGSNTNGVKITLVEETAGVKTPYASGTAIQYRLYEGTSMTGFTLEYSGTTETTDASGVMEIATASHTISDRLFAVVARPSASGIMSDDVIAAIGPVTVVAL